MSQGKNISDREKLICTHPHAALTRNTRGRYAPLAPENIRNEYQRDVHRIAYSQPFRRLRNKTQVFYLPENDHICTRLEHSLHVANAARTVARALNLNEDLAEAIGLGHDLGHAPFGHHGEFVLGEICKREGIAPDFHHEVNSLRVVDKLAQLDRNPTHGLNLTYEVRDGIVSHNGEDFNQRIIKPFEGDKDLDKIKLRRDAGNAISMEGCIVRLVDKVAYAGRDLEDGIKAKLIDPNLIPKNLRDTLGKENGTIVGTLIKDIVNCSSKSDKYIALSQEKFDALNELLKYNYKNIYLGERVQQYRIRATRSIKHLFEVLMETLKETKRFENSEKSKILSPNGKSIKSGGLDVFKNFISDIGYKDDESDAQICIDFISGFTDQYVLRFLEEVFVPKAIV